MFSGVIENLLNSSKNKLSRFTNYLVWFFIALLTISIIRNIGKVTRIRGEIEEEKKKIAKMQSENEELSKKVLETENPEFVEREIRNKLGLVKEGEATVVLPEEEVLKKLAPKIKPDGDSLPDPNWRKWFNLFFSS